MPDLLLYAGIILMGASIAAGVVIAAVLLVSKRKLNTRLDAEYGKKHQ